MRIIIIVVIELLTQKRKQRKRLYSVETQKFQKKMLKQQNQQLQLIKQIQTQQLKLQQQNNELKEFQLKSIQSICATLNAITKNLKHQNSSQSQQKIKSLHINKNKFYTFLSIISLFFAAIMIQKNNVCPSQLDYIMTPITQRFAQNINQSSQYLSNHFNQTSLVDIFNELDSDLIN